MKRIYDMIVLGGGPGGYTAALYAARAGRSVLVLERLSPGGQMALTSEIDNYPGFPEGVDGFELGMKFQEQAHRFGAETEYAEVRSLDLRADPKVLHTPDGDFYARTVVIATGAGPRKLGIENEERLTGRGVHYCAHCDGRFYKDKTVAVIGGGNSAAADALYLSGICNKVYLVHRRDEFRGKPANVDKLKQKGNVEFVLSATPEKVLGESKVEGLEIKQNDEMKTLDVSAVFVAVGQAAQGARLNPELKADEYGYLIADENLQSSIPGVFLAGDLRQKRTRQLTTAVADGSEVITSITEYLK